MTQPPPHFGETPPDRSAPPGEAPKAPLRLAAYFPLTIALLEFPWIGIVIVGTLLLFGRIPPGRSATRILDFVALFPAFVGIVITVALLVRRKPMRLADMICLAVGCVACTMFVIAFGHELIFPGK